MLLSERGARGGAAGIPCPQHRQAAGVTLLSARPGIRAHTDQLLSELTKPQSRCEPFFFLTRLHSFSASSFLAVLLLPVPWLNKQAMIFKSSLYCEDGVTWPRH